MRTTTDASMLTETATMSRRPRAVAGRAAGLVGHLRRRRAVARVVDRPEPVGAVLHNHANSELSMGPFFMTQPDPCLLYTSPSPRD